MKVYINGHVYNTKNTPIVLILTEGDKRNIVNMSAENMLYMSYPSDDMTIKDAQNLIRHVKEIVK